MKQYRVSRDIITRTAQLVIVEAKSEEEALNLADEGKGDVETEGKPEVKYESDYANELDAAGNEV